MELKDYLSIFRRRWPWIAVGVLCVLGVFWYVSSQEKPQWKATALVQVSLSEGETRLVAIGSPFGIASPFLPFRPRMERIKSEAVLWEALKLYEAFGKPFVMSADPAKPFPDWKQVATIEKAEEALSGSPLLKVDSEQREQLSKGLGDQILVEPGAEGSQTFTVTVISASGDEARCKVAAVVRAYELDALRASVAGLVKVKSVFQDKQSVIKAAIVDHEAKAGMQRNAYDLMLKDRDEDAKRVSEYERESEDLRARKDQLSRDIDRLVKDAQYKLSFFGEPRPLTPSTLALVQQGWQEISNLESRIRERLQTAKPDHHDVVKMRTQLEFRKQELNRMIDLQHNFDIGLKLQDRQDLTERLKTLDKSLDNSRAALERKNGSIGKAAPHWDEVDRLKAQDRDLDKALNDIDALSQQRQASAGTVNILKWPGKPQEYLVSRHQNMMFWFVIALFAGLAVAYFMEYIDTAITTEYDVRRHLNLPVVGIIPELPGGEETILSRVPVKSPLSEIFHTAATIIRASMIENGMKSLVITSANPREGKTTVAINIAVAMARKGLRVILVDTDLRIPQIHHWLGVPNTVGVTSLVEGRLQAMEALAQATQGAAAKPSEYLQTTEVPNLFVLPSGPIPASPIHIIESKAMRDLLEEMRNYADVVIFDSPPVCSVSDALSLATIVDGTIFVIGSGYCERRDVSWSKHLLTNIQARIVGALLNRTRESRGVEYYYYYGYYDSGRGRGKTVRRRS